ncbi:MAG: putative outer membrane protein pmp20 precursor [Thermomicrobiales bacterium]|nr:putative outer membrane protein pmp20 precursor [Thermomicrobiales bacterium]
MEPQPIATMIRSLGGMPSRRHLLHALTGAGVGLFATRLPATVAAKKKRRKKRKQVQRRCDVCRRGCDFRGVQAAIDAAKPGATIRLCPETYRGRINIAKNLTLIGAERTRSILDGGGALSPTAVLTVASGATVTVRALTVKGGNGGDGGGIDNAGTLTLDGVSVTANSANQGGGIVNRAGGTLTLTESRVSGNKAGSQGGGLFVFGGDVTLTRTDVAANEAGPGQSGQGGGIFTLGGAVRLNESRVTGNETGLNGGGLLVNGGAVTLNQSQVTGNKATGTGSEGGGLKIISGAVTLNDTAVRGNSAAAGGGIYNVNGTVGTDPETVTGNTPDNCAGMAVGNCVN